MSFKELGIDTLKILPPAAGTVASRYGVHIPDIIQFCMLIYAIGLAAQTCYRLWLWLQRKVTAYRARAAA